MFIKWIFTCVLAFASLGFCSSATCSNDGCLSDTFSSLIADTSTSAQHPATPSQEPAQPLMDTGSEAASGYQAAFLRTLLVLVGILVVVFAGLWFFKRGSLLRLNQTNHLRNIKIIEKRVLSPKTMLYLVEIGGKQILIGESQLELRNLSNLEWIEPPKQGL